MGKRVHDAFTYQSFKIPKHGTVAIVRLLFIISAMKTRARFLSSL
jgi:hypothetical protein